MLFRRYKFCIAMENSNTKDYVTEKMWHALEAGCLPVSKGGGKVWQAYVSYAAFP